MDINSELKDAQLEIRDADHTYSGNRKGLVWFNRTTDKVKAIFNSAVKILATEEYVDTEVTGAIDAAALAVSSGPIMDERSDPSTPANGTLHLYAKSNELYTRNDAGTVNRMARSNEQRVIDIYFIEVNINVNGVTVPSSYTVANIPSGYTWSFSGSFTAVEFFGGTKYNTVFDGKTFASSESAYGTGTNTGSITASPALAGSYGNYSARGVVTVYKKQ